MPQSPRFSWPIFSACVPAAELKEALSRLLSLRFSALPKFGESAISNLNICIFDLDKRVQQAIELYKESQEIKGP
jgi:hypothetical protein